MFLTLLLNRMLMGYYCERILVLAPACSKSHKFSIMPIAEALAERGHDVTVISPFQPKKVVPNLTEIVLGGSAFEETDWFGNVLHKKSPSDVLNNFIETFIRVGYAGYDLLMANEQFQHIFQNRLVDLVIVDAILNDFTLPIIDSLKVPYIYYSPASGTPWTFAAMNVDPHYATVSGGGDFSNPMSFSERAINLVSTELFLAARRRLLLSKLDEKVRPDFPNARPIAAIEKDAQLCIINYHPTTAYIRPLPPTIIPIGALHVTLAKPLPAVLNGHPKIF